MADYILESSLKTRLNAIYCEIFCYLINKLTNFSCASKQLQVYFPLPLVYTNSQNRSDFCCPTKKDRKIFIFPSDFVQSDPIFAVRVNRGLAA